MPKETVAPQITETLQETILSSDAGVSEPLGYLPEVVILLFAALFVVVIFRRLNLSPVLGYLVAGAVIGEGGLGYIHSDELVLLGKLGIVFLLFAIGLELTIERLMTMRLHVFGFGTVQVLLTMLAISALVFYGLKLSLESAIIIGGGLALSSTAIVLKVIADNGAQNTQLGRLALANLLLQDFAVVPLLVLVPLLAGNSENVGVVLASAIFKAFVAMFIIFFLGRMLLRPLFRLIATAKSNELFVATTLLVVLGTSLATEYMGLSLALGAFIAGLLVAETQYQHQVEDSIMPFKDLLMGLFFMTVGMTINIKNIYDHLEFVLAISLSLIIGKALIIALLSRLFRFPWGSSVRAGLLLSQGGEFAFILFGLAANDHIGLLTHEVAEILLLVVTITMALTPALSMLGQYLGECIDGRSDNNPEVPEARESNFSDLSRHVIVAGFGRVGEMVARMLEAKKVSYVVVEADARRARDGKNKGFPVYHGDPTKIDVLQRMGIERARAIIITIRDNTYMKKSVRAINHVYPHIPIVVRTDDLRQSGTLSKLGATVIVPETYEAGLQLAGALLKAIGVSELEVSRIKNQFRASSYEMAKEIMPLTPEPPGGA